MSLKSIVAKLKNRVLWHLEGVQVTSKEQWDAGFRQGTWDFLENENEKLDLLARLCLERTNEQAAVLDVGCGEGLLSERLLSRNYVGVDISPEAIKKAQGRTKPNPNAEHTFAVGEAEAYLNQALASGRKFDAIILNEVLYYIPGYINYMEKLIGLLAPGGVFIVSIFNNRNSKVWQKVYSRFSSMCVDQRSVSHGDALWHIAVFRARAG